MQKDGTYMGDLEIQAFCNIRNVAFQVATDKNVAAPSTGLGMMFHPYHFLDQAITMSKPVATYHILHRGHGHFEPCIRRDRVSYTIIRVPIIRGQVTSASSVECMSPDNENCAYDPHWLDTVHTKHGLQAALNVLQESDRAWFVNRLFNEGQPLYTQHEAEDAWMRRLSHLCTELRLQMPQLRKMGLDIHLMRAMLESDGM